MKGEHRMFHRSSKQVLWSVFVALLLTVPAYAVKNFKISNFGGGHQIWFEAEDYDERNPDTNAYYPVVDAAGAFGKAITRTGNAGGMIRWTFDISTTGGKGGTWYFWGRVINPSNTSDYMLVKGDPGDPVIPSGPPFPGNDGTAPFNNAHDRIFEETDGPPWTWCLKGHDEGHTKVLQNGENTMYIFHRQGDSTVFWDVFLWTDSPTYVPTDADYQKAAVVLPGRALNPSPVNGATDVFRNAILSWSPAPGGGKQDVYFGTGFDAVNQATATADPAGVYRGRFDPNTYAVGVLTYGQTYYWRVDKVGVPPDTTIVKGTVWSFTVEPYAYPITKITATASSAQNGMGPENTINGSGLTGDLHGTDMLTMWMSAGAQPNWIQYQFDQTYRLYDLKVWNCNQPMEPYVGFGAKDVKVEYSTDGATWTAWANVPPFAQATGLSTYTANTTVSFGGVLARYVKLTINSTWGGMGTITGLSEVRFSYVPVLARLPQPATGAAGQSLTTTLSWRPGRAAASHKVFFGADPNAVAKGTAAPKTVTGYTFDPGALLYGTTYYWRVDEVNTVTYPGDVWSFTTKEYAVVDDFESYNDDKNRIYETWIDGITDSKSGSQVGYNAAPFAETVIVHGGAQSMPLLYDNSKSPFYSETTRDLGTAQDWTGSGATHMDLWFRGYPAPTSMTVAETGGKMSLTGSGTDIWNNSDQFSFAYKMLTGDGSIVARVTDKGTGTNTWAKGGVMIRASLNGGSTFAAMVLSDNSDGTASYGYSLQYRLTTDGAAASADGTAPTINVPYWVKVQRVGDNFSSYVSADGKTWRQQGTTQTIKMTDPVLIGICVTSHQAGEQRTEQFDNIVMTGTVTGSWQGAQITSPQYNSPAGLYVVLQDTSGKSKTAAHADPAAAATGA
jgi:hypothetical protein